jgi:transposase
MKNTDTKEKFIELRAAGLSFDKIAAKINVSKPTLLKWNKELEKEISELKEVRFEKILETYKANKEQRITRLARELKDAWDAFEKQDYKDLTKREILLMIIRMERRLIEETEPKKVLKSEEDTDNEPIKINVHRKTILPEKDKIDREKL